MNTIKLPKNTDTIYKVLQIQYVKYCETKTYSNISSISSN